MGIVRESANGRIAYNLPSSHLGFVFRDIVLEFRDGRIVRAEANDRERVEAILDSAAGGLSARPLPAASPRDAGPTTA